MTTPGQALAEARRRIGLPASAPGRAWAVRRLDGQSSYFLVHVAGHLACLDAGAAALMASAASAAAPVRISAAQACAAAGLPGAAAELVWQPCRATRSMFDPLWCLEHAGRQVFVDQRGRVWPTLELGGPGGAVG